MRLMREVRVFVGDEAPSGGRNTWSGSPGNGPLRGQWVVRAHVQGPVSTLTGYVCELGTIDSRVRRDVVPILLSAGMQGHWSCATLLEALGWALEAIGRAGIDGAILHQLELGLSPQLWLSAHRQVKTVLQVTQSFEFSASHRLALAGKSDAENQALFGKCANPNGHGHNYVVDVTIGGGDTDATWLGDLVGMQDLVRKRVLDRFDHRNLNLDCAEFSERNPTVENIAQVIWELLVSAMSAGRLHRVRVWETPKTYAEYDGRPG